MRDHVHFQRVAYLYIACEVVCSSLSVMLNERLFSTEF